MMLSKITVFLILSLLVINGVRISLIIGEFIEESFCD